MRLAEYSAQVRGEIEVALEHDIKLDVQNEQLQVAMLYAVQTVGKRLRPLLTLAVAETFGAQREQIMKAANALELIHTYSLIHDDLPAMDDDQLRRGKPTVHVQFDEALAILAGDALQSLAFQWLTTGNELTAVQQANLVRLLAENAGPNGMVGGQVLDMAATDGDEITLAELQVLHKQKTGALLAYAAEAGGVLAGVTAPVQALLAEFGITFGLAFQIKDDLDDLNQDEEEDKQSFPYLLGVTGAQDALRATVQQAADILAQIDATTEADMTLLTSFLDYFDETVA